MEMGLLTMTLVVLTVLFMLGLWFMDIAVSAELAGKNVEIQSLTLKDVPPRIAYHMGLLLVLATYLVLILVILIEKKLLVVKI